MKKIEIYSNDTNYVVFTVYGKDSCGARTIHNLTGAEVKFGMANKIEPNFTPEFVYPCTIEDAVNGKVSVRFKTQKSGKFYGELEIKFPNFNRVQTTQFIIEVKPSKRLF